MTYSATEVLTFITALGVLIGGLGATIVNIIVALNQGKKLAVVETKTDGLVNQVAEVHTLTNSGLASVKAELATANAQNATLHDIVRDLKSEREKAAIVAAVALPVAAPLPVEVVNQPLTVKDHP